jgi:hypothetical protein
MRGRLDLPIGCLACGQAPSLTVEEFENRLLAAYAKAKSKHKRLTKAESLLQLPAFFDRSCGANLENLH